MSSQGTDSASQELQLVTTNDGISVTDVLKRMHACKTNTTCNKSILMFNEWVGPQSVKDIVIDLFDTEWEKAPNTARGLPVRKLLLYGPSGTGKTAFALMLARWDAATLYRMPLGILINDGVDDEAVVRTLMQEAADTAPSILLFDDIDGLLSKRRSSDVLGQRLTAAFKACCDLVVSDGPSISIIATTNYPWVLDTDEVLPKFDLQVLIDLPNEDERTQLIEKRLKRSNWYHCLSPNDVAELARAFAGYSGCDIEAVIGLARETLIMDAERAIRFVPISVRGVERWMPAEPGQLHVTVFTEDEKKRTRLQYRPIDKPSLIAQIARRRPSVKPERADVYRTWGTKDWAKERLAEVGLD